MEFIKHPQHDRFIGKPVTWDETRDGPCGDLSVHYIPNPPYCDTMESAWRPQVLEALHMALRTANLRLGIVGARQHPPVYMAVYSEEVLPTRKELEQNIASLLGELVRLSDSFGYQFTVSTANNAEGKAEYGIHVWDVHELQETRAAQATFCQPQPAEPAESLNPAEPAEPADVMPTAAVPEHWDSHGEPKPGNPLLEVHDLSNKVPVCKYTKAPCVEGDACTCMQPHFVGERPTEFVDRNDPAEPDQTPRAEDHGS